jgi:hypothetical protein
MPLVPFFIGDEIGGGDIAGGSSSGGGAATAADSAQITEFVTEEGGLLAVAFGEHLVAGHLIVHKYSPGPPPSSIFAVALGDGQGSRWDSLVNVWYAGEALAAVSLSDGTTPGYHFHPGTISTGISDSLQGVDTYLPPRMANSPRPQPPERPWFAQAMRISARKRQLRFQQSLLHP